ncbi:MAG: hypothetical protein U1C57_00465 [Candidatus Doudnabacteria bacterium]|nr:hypothetical protein [Candidatus Doudnabacteria bacterium]
MKEFFELVSQLLGFSKDIAGAGLSKVRSALVAYLQFLKKASIVYGFFLALAAMVLTFGTLFASRPVVTLAVLLGGIATLALAFAAFPIIWAVQKGAEWGVLRKTFQFYGSMALWIFLLAYFFYRFDVAPTNVPIVFLLAGFLAIGSVFLGIGMGPKYLAWRARFVFTVLVISLILTALFPGMPGDLKILGNWLEKSRRQKVEEITGTQIESPRAREYSADLIFFDPDGQPKFSYYRKEDGGIDLFTLGRIHPRYGLPLEPVTPEIVQELEKADQNKRAAEQAKLKADEAAKQAEIAKRAEAAAKATADWNAKMAAEERSRQEAQAKAAAEARAEARRRVEAARLAEERKRAEETKQAEEKRIAELQRLVAETKQAAEKAAVPVQSGQAFRSPETQPPQPKIITVKLLAGTKIDVRLDQRLSTETSQAGEVFRAVLARSVSIGGTVLPVGTVFEGRILELERPGRVSGVASLSLALTTFSFEGQSVSTETDPLTLGGKTTKGKDAAKIGIGAGIGAAIGAVWAGRDGAVEGAGIGAGAGTAEVLATRGEEINLEPEHLLVFRLAEDVSFEIRRAD